MPSAVGPALLRSETPTRFIEILRVQREPDAASIRSRRLRLRLRMETANSFKTRGVASEVCLVAHDSPGCALKAACAEEGFRGGRGGGGYLRGGGEGGQDLEERSTINSLSGCTSRKLLCRMAKLIPLHLQVRPCALRKPSQSSIGLIYAAALSALYSSAPDVP